MNHHNLCMMKNKWKTRLSYGLYAMSLAFVAVAPLAYFLYSDLYEIDEPVAIEFTQPKSIIHGKVYEVLSIEVLDGHIFRVLLSDQNWHEVRLASVTRQDATAKVIEVLKKINNPTITFRRKIEEYWIIDFNMILFGKKVSMLEWLAENKLLL